MKGPVWTCRVALPRGNGEQRRPRPPLISRLQVQAAKVAHAERVGPQVAAAVAVRGCKVRGRPVATGRPGAVRARHRVARRGDSGLWQQCRAGRAAAGNVAGAWWSRGGCAHGRGGRGGVCAGAPWCGAPRIWAAPTPRLHLNAATHLRFRAPYVLCVWGCRSPVWPAGGEEEHGAHRYLQEVAFG
jgi:hypothetical protein